MAFFDKIPRAALHFLVNLPEILADHAGTKELNSPDKEEREKHRGPARDRLTFDPRVNDPPPDEEGRNAYEKTEPHDEAEGLRAEGSHSVPSKGEHLPKRIFRFAGEARVASIVDARRRVAEEWDDSPEKKIRFIEVT